MSVSSKDFTTISQNLEILKGMIKVRTVKALATGLVQILAAAQPRVPVDTGELRESGNARIMLGGRRGIVIAKGTKSGTVNVLLDKITYKKVKGVSRIDAVVEYQKMVDDFDVAVWTHECLSPHGSGTRPEARQPHTGPKYLEQAYKEVRPSFLAQLNSIVSEESIAKDIKKASGKTFKPRGRYTVDQRVMVFNRIDSLGYFR